MKSAIVTSPAGDLETPLLAVIVPAGTTVPASLAALDRATGGIVARAITSGDFKGKRDEAQLLYPVSGKIQRLLLVGVGKGADVTRSGLRRAAAVAAKRARQLGAKAFTLLVAAEARNGVRPKDWGQVAVEGAVPAEANGCPSTARSTRVTAPSSDAAAVTSTVPCTLAPAAGAASVTLGLMCGCRRRSRPPAWAAGSPWRSRRSDSRSIYLWSSPSDRP